MSALLYRLKLKNCDCTELIFNEDDIVLRIDRSLRNTLIESISDTDLINIKSDCDFDNNCNLDNDYS
jgi:hypothetical protein